MSIAANTPDFTDTALASEAPRAATRIVEQALADDKREGLRMAVKARWVSLAIIGVLIIYLDPSWDILYYHLCLLGFALIGLAQLKIGRVGRSRPELWLMFCDLALMTYVIIAPNPLREDIWPPPTRFLLDNFIYFYVLLAGATLAYSWRTLIAMGLWTTGLWLGATLWMAGQPLVDPGLSDAIAAAASSYPGLGNLLDPNSVNFPERVKEVVLFLIIASILALAGWRSRNLLIRHAAVERERANLVRYFSPNVVEELSQNDEPLKQIRTQDVAVLFVDIVGFTALADATAPERVIATLRGFHARMEAEIFRHHGTLDKYLGDGLMATFGTPTTSPNDAGNALRCARAMITALGEWNAERAARGETPIRAGLGLHYGPVVLGDIGGNCLEFAVIGSSVNIASRLEALTRDLNVALIASDALVTQAQGEAERQDADFTGLEQQRTPQAIRGVAQAIDIWTLAN